MKKSSCDTCKFRAKYDADPDSFLGRLWRWHTNWCPGWSRHMAAMPVESRKKIAKHYHMKKYLS